MSAIGCGPGGLYPTNENKADEPCRKQSECETAYQHLHKSQEELSEAIAHLSNRLGPVLGSSTAGQSDAPSQAPQSEVHGWLIAAEERAWALTRRVRAITESLTI